MTDIVAEIEARVRKTICSTFNVSRGEETIEGRISAADFGTLLKEIERLRSLARAASLPDPTPTPPFTMKF